MGRLLRRFRRDRSGATMVEYALLVGALSLVILAGMGQAMEAVKAVFVSHSEKFDAH